MGLFGEGFYFVIEIYGLNRICFGVGNLPSQVKYCRYVSNPQKSLCFWNDQDSIIYIHIYLGPTVAEW